MTTPTHALPASSERRIYQLDLRSWKGATLAVLALRLLLAGWVLFVSAVYPFTALEQQVSIVPGTSSFGQWMQRVLVAPWLRYDTWNYQRIIDHGYSLEEGTAAFHPLYPLLASPLSWLFGNNPVLALLTVSTLATIVLCVLLARYTELFHDPELVQTTGWLLLIVPPAYILLAPYNESTFLLLAVGALWMMHRERWWLAGLLGGLAALTRQQGIALALPLAWGLFTAIRGGRTRVWNIAALGLVPLGYALFVLYRAVTLGDLAALANAAGPADFLRRLLVSSSSEQVVVGQRIAWPWEPLFAVIGLIAAGSDTHAQLINLLLGWAGVLAALFGLRWMTVPERLYVLGIIGLSLCYYNSDISPYLSLPRHMLLAFPILFVVARWVGTGARRRILFEGLFLFNLFLAGAFTGRGWVP